MKKQQNIDAQFAVDELNKMLKIDKAGIQAITTTYHCVSDSFAKSDTKAVMGFNSKNNSYVMGAIGLLNAFVINGKVAACLDEGMNLIKFTVFHVEPEEEKP